MNRQSQKERVLAMLRTYGKYGVRSDRFLEVGIPRAAARILELRNEGHEISGERDKQFVRYYLANSAGFGTGVPPPRGTEGVGCSSRSRASADPGGDSPGGALPSAPGEPARQPQTSREREAREIEKSLERQDAYWRRVGGHPSPPQPPTGDLHLFDPAEARKRPLSAFTDAEA